MEDSPITGNPTYAHYVLLAFPGGLSRFQRSSIAHLPVVSHLYFPCCRHVPPCLPAYMSLFQYPCEGAMETRRYSLRDYRNENHQGAGKDQVQALRCNRMPFSGDLLHLPVWVCFWICFQSFGSFCCHSFTCLLYTSDAADDLLCVDLGGRRIIKKK